MSTNGTLQTFDFEVALSVESPSYQDEGFVTYLGNLNHFNTMPLQFSAEGAPPLRLGFRVLSNDTKQVLFEDRAAFDVSSLAPKLSYPLKINVPQSLISQASVVLMVDFLYENEFWFHEMFKREPTLFLVEAVNIAKQLEVAESSLPVEASIVAKALAAFKDFDFASYGALQEMGESRDPGLRGAQFDPSTLAALNFSEDATDVMPLTELMRHYALTRRQGKARGPTSRTARFELLREMFPFMSSIDDDGGEFIPASSIAYLNEPPLADGLFDVPMTRLMLWYWLSEGKNLRPYMRLDRESVYWWWATGAMPAKQVPPTLIGNEALSYLAGVHEDFRGRLVPLSRFYFKAHKESRALQEKYDLKLDSGLIAYSFDTLIHNLPHRINQFFFGSGTLEFWGQLITGDRRDPSLFEFALALQLDESAVKVSSGSLIDCRKLVRNLVIGKTKTSVTSWLALYSTATRDLLEKRIARGEASRQTNSPEQASIVGLTGSASGLGVNARMSKVVLENLGLTVNMADSRWPSERPMRHKGMVLYHINADAVPMALLEGGGKQFRVDRRVGFFLWELNAVPESHRLGLGLVDEIWVPTEFLRNVYAEAAKVPVRNVGKFLLTPDLSKLQRRKNAAFTFLVSFDFHSGVERKNPLDAVRAFSKAFPPHVKNVAMVIKTTEYVPNHWGDPYDQWLKVMEIAKKDPRVRIVTEMLSDPTYFSLINDCDCVVSTHRAEGFGYLPAYAMLLGKSIIATDYSGTTDFCKPDTAWLLKYKLKPVVPGEFIIDVPGAVWAEVDMDHLVETMRKVFDDREARQQKEQAARAFVQERYSLQAQSERYKDLMQPFGYTFRGVDR